jgi:hypothetical protein
MNTKEKILQYLDFKEISQGKFCRKIGVSNGFLASGKHIGSEKLKIIRDNYVDLNMDWLIYDEGEMISNKNVINERELVYDRSSNDSINISKKLTTALKENNLTETLEVLIKEYISLQKKQVITQSTLADLVLGFDKLEEKVNTIENKS